MEVAAFGQSPPYLWSLSEMAKSSLQAYLSITMLGLAPYALYLVVFYAEPGFPWHTYITLFVGYYSSFVILLLVPIDIACTITDRRSTSVNDSVYQNDMATLSDTYSVFFAIILIFGSFLLSFQEYYNSDGKSCATMFCSIIIPIVDC